MPSFGISSSFQLCVSIKFVLQQKKITMSVCLCNRRTKKNLGFDGGQRQWFRMEIIDQQTGMLIANLSSFQPEFDVTGLDSERLLKLAVMAVNQRGVSDRVILEAQTLKAAEKRMGKC